MELLIKFLNIVIKHKLTTFLFTIVLFMIIYSFFIIFDIKKIILFVFQFLVR